MCRCMRRPNHKSLAKPRLPVAARDGVWTGDSFETALSRIARLLGRAAAAELARDMDPVSTPSDPAPDPDDR